jgi:hypothetical protein
LIINLIVKHTSSYLLHSTYKKNNSEGNYLTEIWLPVLKSLFAINGNLIHLKFGETIPDDSTEEKSISISIIVFIAAITQMDKDLCIEGKPSIAGKRATSKANLILT